MADAKISALNAKTTVHDTDVFPIVDIEAETDETKKITGANMKAQMVAGHKDLTTGVHGVGAGTVAKTADIPSFATPAIGLRSSAEAGDAVTVIRSNASIAAFDTTSPSTQAFADSAVVGTAAFAARRDHKHAMMADPVTAHTALTTGVHGVGTQYIAKTRYSNQATPWSPDMITTMVSWASLDACTVGGTGGTVTARNIDLYFTTATTANNNPHCRTNGAVTTPFVTGKMFVLEFPIVHYTVRTDAELYFFLVNDTTLPPLQTKKHLGFIVKDRVIWASSADGTDQTSTNTSTSITDADYSYQVLKICYIPGTSLKYYLDEVEIASHNVATDKVPPAAADWYVFTTGIKTLNTTQKLFNVARFISLKEL